MECITVKVRSNSRISVSWLLNIILTTPSSANKANKVNEVYINWKEKKTISNGAITNLGNLTDLQKCEK